MQNIPLASWIALGGKCAACKAPHQRALPAGRALHGPCLARSSRGASAGVPRSWPRSSSPGRSSRRPSIDFDTQLLPDRITLPLLWLGLLVNIVGLFVDLRSAVIGAAGRLPARSGACTGASSSLAGKEGMGFGDFKLLAALGAWTGWQTLPLILLVSAGAGAVIGIAMIWLSGKGRDTRIPFGPYLAAGGLVALALGARGGHRLPGAVPVVIRTIGLTGGIGSGKSTAAGFLARLGASVVDADEISRELTAAGGAALPALARGVRRFPRSGRRRPGSRGDARARLFRSGGAGAAGGDPAPAHPRGSRPPRWPRRRGPTRSSSCRCSSSPAPTSGGSNASSWSTWTRSCRSGRTVGRSGLARGEVRAIMATQWPRWRRLQAADEVLWNGGRSRGAAARSASACMGGFARPSRPR